MSDTTAGGQPVKNILLGCDPQVNLRITETEFGQLFIVIESADPTLQPGDLDIDGIFFNLAQDSALASLNFFPEPNTGSIFSPVTGIQANANSVNTLANGAQVADEYDVGIQFGTVENSTAGGVDQANFTLWSDYGPLLFEDLDLSSLAVVVNSDAGNGQVLTGGGAGDPVFVDTQALFENFDHIHDPAQSAAIVRDDGWVISNDQLATNSCYEGMLKLAEVPTDGPVSYAMDIRTCNVSYFENSGAAADSLRLEVQIDGGDWVLLDEFRVNDHGTAMVGSETGKTFGNHYTTLEYSGGILDTAEQDVQFRLISDMTATNEIVYIDNISVTSSEEVPPGECVEEIALSDDFNDIHYAAQSDIIASADDWAVDTWYGDLNTDGCKDGTLQLETVQAGGSAKISFDAAAGCLGNFENSGALADSLRLEVQLNDGEWLLLDEFRVNDHGTAMVGSETGQTFGHQYGTLTYEGGVLDDANGDVTFRFVSDISASNEDIYIDNIEVTTCTEAPPVEECGQYDVGYIAGVPILPQPEETPEEPAAEEEMVEAFA